MIIDISEFELDHIVPLFRALHNFHVDEMPWRYHLHGSDEGFHSELKDRIKSGSWILGLDAGWGLAGYLMGTPRITSESHMDRAQRHLTIDHLYIAPTHRRKGWASKLMQAALDRGRREGFNRWGVGYNAFNQDAARFYKSFGAEDHGCYSTGVLDS